jgi:hypothetical protein
MRGEVGEIDPASLADVELVTFLVEFRRLADAAEACWVAAVGEMDRRVLWRVDGARSAVVWLRRECRVSRPFAVNAVSVARALRDLPATSATFRAGRIGIDHARAISSAVSPDRVQAARQADPIFARAAAWMEPHQVARVVRSWTQLAEPDSG